MTDAPTNRIPPWDGETVKRMAREWLTNERFLIIAFTDQDARDLTSSFLVLALADASTLPDNIAGATELYSKATPLAVNGMPTFFSCEFIPEESVEALIVEAKRMAEALR